MARTTLPEGLGWLWNPIQAGRAAGLNQQQIWDAIRSERDRLGTKLSFQAAQWVSRLTGIAGRQEAGYTRFNQADRSELFTRAMAAPEINARSLVAQSLNPGYLVRFDLTYLDPAGNQVTKTVSMRDDWTPDMTVGDVIDRVAEAAEGLALDYGQGLIGYSNLKPVSV